MLPYYDDYLHSHHKVIFKPILFASIILSLCFINNYTEITFIELIWGIYSIFLVIFISAVNNERVYWKYCFLSGKFSFGYKNRSDFKDNHTSLWFFIKRMIIYFIISITTFVAIPFLFLNYIYDHKTSSIILMGFLLSPMLIWLFMQFVIDYFFKKSLFILDGYSFEQEDKPEFKLYFVIIREVLFSLIVNFAIVFPISRKAAFSLDNGYWDLHFIIALIILLYSVLGIMLFLAKGRKIHYFLVAVIFYKINRRMEKARKANLIPRILTLLFIIPLFTILFCFLFFMFNIEYQFIFIYITCLFPVFWVYYQERSNRLKQDYLLAIDMVIRLNALKGL